MKENIDSKNIGNRKFIIELRFNSNVIILDKRGEIVRSIQNLKIFPNFHWEIGQGEIIMKDNSDDKEAKNAIRVTLNRINFISYQIDTVDSFYNKFEKIYKKLKDVVGDFDILRVGCRIIGTYHTKSIKYDALIKNFRDCFPSNFFLNNYITKDLLFNMVYENGMYQIGPVSDTDSFYEREFDISGCDKHIGVAIDTDNYITKSSGDINDNSVIKDVYMLSLSVEKDLYLNLMNL